MSTIKIHRHQITLLPDSTRVILRSFISSNPYLVANIINRCLALSEEKSNNELKSVMLDFASRHLEFEPTLISHFNRIATLVPGKSNLSYERKLLLGALFSGEYALESAALFNPSIIPHPNQDNVVAGGLRFIMSLRATGEGHISSIEFRIGMIHPDGHITIDTTSPFVSSPKIVPNSSYQKGRFIAKLQEMGLWGAHANDIINPLGDTFTRIHLEQSISRTKHIFQAFTRNLTATIDSIRWLADSNYEIIFDEKLALSERIIFPVSPNESNGIEDARFVKFVDDDNSVVFYATYTAYNGHNILPQFIETKDFLSFRMLTLSGQAVENKGMALFPRKINGNFAMISRQDDENLYIMFSDNIHHWNQKHLLKKPTQAWELVKIGNCGSPIETRAGWLIITHGVGPMRKYCIGALLLKLTDPTVVIGSLQEPLIKPEGSDREGYVPNVVYSCGSLVHGGDLVLAYALSDKASVIASIHLEDLLTALMSS